MMNLSAASPKTVRLRFKNPRYERIVRINTESIAKKMGFSEDQVFDITLAVEEAYANAIEHSGCCPSELELEILYQLFPDRMEISIQDSGCGFDGNNSRSFPAEADLSSDRGRGLGLIKSLSDHAEILSAPGAGTLIRITKFLRKPGIGKRSKIA